MMEFAQRGTDKEKIDLLETVTEPTDLDKTNCCALLMRYGGDQDITLRLCDIASSWGYSPSMLNTECREIWLSGFRPGYIDSSIGSSNDIDSDS
jgi:hypothetical protein